MKGLQKEAHQEEEVLVVPADGSKSLHFAPKAHAIGDPGAVVVHSQHAGITDSAVVTYRTYASKVISSPHRSGLYLHEMRLRERHLGRREHFVQ